MPWLEPCGSPPHAPLSPTSQAGCCCTPPLSPQAAAVACLSLVSPACAAVARRSSQPHPKTGCCRAPPLSLLVAAGCSRAPPSHNLGRPPSCASSLASTPERAAVSLAELSRARQAASRTSSLPSRLLSHASLSPARRPPPSALLSHPTRADRSRTPPPQAAMARLLRMLSACARMPDLRTMPVIYPAGVLACAWLLALALYTPGA